MIRAIRPNAMAQDDLKAQILDAALAHVPFDGWSERTLQAAIADVAVPAGLARPLFPRGGVTPCGDL